MHPSISLFRENPQKITVWEKLRESVTASFISSTKLKVQAL
jgi:hypothetical protein